MTDISYQTFGYNGIVAHIHAITAVYATVFTEPPYAETPQQIEQFAVGLPATSNRSGFNCITAWNNDELIGFIYGYTHLRSQWFARATAPPPPNLADVDRCFIVDWAVLQGWRGVGIGGELIRQMLTNRPERHALLTARPESNAYQLYQRAGWVKVGDSVPIESNPRPAMHIMHLPLI